VPGYLLDTNHVNAAFDHNPAFLNRARNMQPDRLLYVCSITLGEIEASYHITNRDQEKIEACRKFIRNTYQRGRDGNSYVLCVDGWTKEDYAEVLKRIWKNTPPSSAKVKTEKHLVHLDVDINDVWIFATARKHRLTLLTTDRMNVIRREFPEVAVENWLLP